MGAVTLFLIALVPLYSIQRPVEIGAIEGLNLQLIEASYGPLVSGDVISQPLGHVATGLSEVDIYAATGGHSHLAPWQMRLLDSEAVLRQGTANVISENGDVAHVRFAFVPVAGSAARDLRLEITAPDATSDNAMYLFVVAKPNGGPRATANGHATGFVTPMGFRFGALEPLQAQAGQAVQRASQYRPEPFKGGVLLAILTVGLLLAIAFLLAISL